VTPACVASDAVTVCAGAVRNVTLKERVPLTRAALAGKAAAGSLAERATVSLVLMRFQFASTALTVTLKATPALCALGVPVFPVPGTALSPGTSNCNFANGPATTAMGEEVIEMSPLAAKVMVMFVATRWERFVNVASPLNAVSVGVPCKLPAPCPVLLVADTAELLSFVT